MNATGPAEGVSDYDGFDFGGLWAGRDRVTEVERSIVAAALGPVDRRRILEIGTGFGRLLGTLEALSPEVVACDFNRNGLSAVPADRSTCRVAANLYHLPFASDTFPAAVMVRVYHHLTDPTAALRELARVLTPGGRLLVSYNPRPSVGTLANDLRQAVARGGAPPRGSVTFARGRVALDPSPFPVFVADRAEFYATAREAQLSGGSEVGAGFEEFRAVRWAPADLWVRFGRLFARVPGFPSRFALLEKPGRPPLELIARDRWLACPRCREPLHDPGPNPAVRCPACGFEGNQRDGLLDLRYVPDGAPRWSVRE